MAAILFDSVRPVNSGIVAQVQHSLAAKMIVNCLFICVFSAVYYGKNYVIVCVHFCLLVF